MDKTSNDILEPNRRNLYLDEIKSYLTKNINFPTVIGYSIYKIKLDQFLCQTY